MSAIKKIIMNSLELPRESEKHIKDNPEMETKFHHRSHLTSGCLNVSLQELQNHIISK